MNNQVTNLVAQSPTTCRMIVEFDVPIGTDLANTTFDVGIKVNGEESKEVFVESAVVTNSELKDFKII